MKVSGQLHVPAALHPAIMRYEAGGSRTGLYVTCIEKPVYYKQYIQKLATHLQVLND